jgi:transcriptional regulator with GAF, ATPase, and Fis domain
MVARALHEMTQRKERPFAVCNRAAVVETLFEVELFGHLVPKPELPQR